MQDNVKKIGLIAAVVIMLLLAGFTTYKSFFGSGFTNDDSEIWLKCARPECNTAYSLTPDQFTKIREDNPMGPMLVMPGTMQAFKCDKCGQQSAYMATKCEKCGEVYVMNIDVPIGQTDYPDRCPKCKYSYMAEMQKEQK